MAGYLFKLLFVFNMIILECPYQSITFNMGILSGFRQLCVGRACFGWFQGGKYWSQMVSGRFGWFRVILLFSNYTQRLGRKLNLQGGPPHAPVLKWQQRNRKVWS